MYLSDWTRPNIAYKLDRFNQYPQSSSQYNWKAIHKVLKYMKSTINHGLC